MFRLQVQENPFAERRQQIPSAVENKTFFTLRDSSMNKPVKHGLDLLNMKTTGLKYNLARKERKCTEKAK